MGLVNFIRKEADFIKNKTIAFIRKEVPIIKGAVRRNLPRVQRFVEREKLILKDKLGDVKRRVDVEFENGKFSQAEVQGLKKRLGKKHSGLQHQKFARQINQKTTKQLNRQVDSMVFDVGEVFTVSTGTGTFTCKPVKRKQTNSRR